MLSTACSVNNVDKNRGNFPFYPLIPISLSTCEHVRFKGLAIAREAHKKGTC